MNASPERPESTVDPKLLEILVCPMTKGPLEYDAAKQELISRSAKLAYPIRDGIRIMLPEEARRPGKPPGRTPSESSRIAGLKPGDSVIGRRSNDEDLGPQHLVERPEGDV